MKRAVAALDLWFVDRGGIVLPRHRLEEMGTGEVAGRRAAR
jgi:hypothetical protein